MPQTVDQLTAAFRQLHAATLAAGWSSPDTFNELRSWVTAVKHLELEDAHWNAAIQLLIGAIYARFSLPDPAGFVSGALVAQDAYLAANTL